jgi:MPBQ/MSBQ methyltransferase
VVVVDVRDLVRDHYGDVDVTVVLDALAHHGADLAHLRPEDLFPVDQLHAGGADATRHVLERLGVGPGTRLLDVGCGVGGPSRIAAMAGADVTGVDLTPEFVLAARAFTDRVGLATKARFLTTAAESLPLEDGSFDAAMMVHVGMNVPDKRALFAEVHRVLEPGGLFAAYEQVATGTGTPTYPLPWAEDERSSFVETPEQYVEALTAAGFTDVEVEDRTAATTGPPPTGPLNQASIFGPAFVERIGNNIAATRAGVLRAVLLLARA